MSGPSEQIRKIGRLFSCVRGEHCLKLHDLVNAAYIDYDVDDSPVH